jgi:KOW motif
MVDADEIGPRFEAGDLVQVNSGTFAGMNGTISEVYVDEGRLKVLVNVFDRETLVELEFDQDAKSEASDLVGSGEGVRARASGDISEHSRILTKRRPTREALLRSKNATAGADCCSSPGFPR